MLFGTKDAIHDIGVNTGVLVQDLVDSIGEQTPRSVVWPLSYRTTEGKHAAHRIWMSESGPQQWSLNLQFISTSMSRSDYLL